MMLKQRCIVRFLKQQNASSGKKENLLAFPLKNRYSLIEQMFYYFAKAKKGKAKRDRDGKQEYGIQV